MTKKDYKLIAKKIHYMTTLSSITGNGLTIDKEQILLALGCLEQHLSDAFEKDNGAFDRFKFIQATGLDVDF